MSLNLGTEGCQAARELRTVASWADLRTALHKLVVARMNTALDAPPELRVDQSAYARALRDVWMAFEAATNGEPIQRTAKPGPEKNSAAR